MPSLSTADYISKMQEVEGWLSNTDAEFFNIINEVQTEATVEGDMVEIGVWHGKSAILLYTLLRSGENLFATDLFDLRSPDHAYFNDPAIFDGHCRSFGCDERITKIKLNTEKNGHQLLEQLVKRKIRLFHVDGGHDYKVAKKDIDLAMQLTSANGVIVFDDFFNKKHPGVTQAVMETLMVHRTWFPFLMTNKKLWICNIKMHFKYYNAIKKISGLSGKSTKFFSKSCILAIS